MKIQRQAGRGKGSILDGVTRLIATAEVQEERPYLAWLGHSLLAGTIHQQYIEEMAKKPDALEGLTEEEVDEARYVWGCVGEDRGVDRTFSHMQELQEKGFIRDLTRLPGRGRYAGRFEYFFTDKLQIVVTAASRAAKAD